LPKAAAEAALFRRLRLRILATMVRQAFGGSRFRSALILALTLALWTIMYFMFAEGFELMRWLVGHEGTRVQIAQAIFNVFFLALSFMLLVSSAIIMYSALYRGRDVPFLQTLPTRSRQIVLYKFQETLLVACWGFFLLGSPLVLAYGQTVGAPWYFYALLLPFMVAFVLIPTGLGATTCVLLVRFLPRQRYLLTGILAGCGVLLLLAVGWVIVREATPHNVLSLGWFQAALARLQYSEQPILPSWWLSTGLLEAAHPANSLERSSLAECLGLLAVLTSNAMMLYLLLGYVGHLHFSRGFSALCDSTSNRRVARNSILDRTFWHVTLFLPGIMRRLLAKDFRIFRRDIMQWSQFAIFFGLLTFYFLNIRRLHFGPEYAEWSIVVSFLNVAVVGLLLATFTTRFIFPLLSLEGRRIWLLATLPVDRGAIVGCKFLFAAGIATPPCSTLVLLSDMTLGLTGTAPLIVLAHQLTCLGLCCGLAGIAVGLGARFPNLREMTPAKIAAGFGGTLTLVLSVVFIGAGVLATAVPAWYWVRAGQPGVEAAGVWDAAGKMLQLGSLHSVFFGMLVTAVLAISATVIPLSTGLHSFRQQDF
jgi:ABC-2 type transport system permease protein